MEAQCQRVWRAAQYHGLDTAMYCNAEPPKRRRLGGRWPWIRLRARRPGAVSTCHPGMMAPWITRCCRALHPFRAGARLLELKSSRRRARPGVDGCTSERSIGQHLLCDERRGSWAGPAWLPILMVARIPARKGGAGTLRRCSICRLATSAGDIARQQGPCRQRCCNQGYRDRPAGARCVCASDQCGARPACRCGHRKSRA
jgi:hypothetical protein